MPAATHLRHVALGVTALDVATDFAEQTWGLVLVERSPDAAYFAAAGSPEPFVLRLRQADVARIDHISFGARTADDVAAFAEDATKREILVSGPAELERIGGGVAVRFFDPDGRVIELASDVEDRAYRELSERESIPRSLSHVVVNTPDMERVAQFYTEFLGMRVSDWMADMMTFLRCGVDHHALALSSCSHASLNHVAFEARGLDEFLRAAGRVTRADHPILWGPGRHGVGDNTFAYFHEPGGFVYEFTTELEKIVEADREPRRWELGPDSADQWGFAGGDPRAFEVMRGVPDPGAWQAAPI